MNKKLLTVAMAAAMSAPTTSHAVKYALSGQVNRAIVYNDDGVATDVQHIDNSSSGTRFRLKGSEDIANGMKVGFNWEWQNQSNPGGGPIKSSDFGPSGGNQSMRKAEVWFSGSWGKFSVGQGDGAGNGTTEHDLSDTWNVAYAGRTSFAAATAWRTSGGSEITSAGGTVAPGGGGLTHGDTFSHFDAFSRYDRVRYDTPALGPVVVSASLGQQHQVEFAGRLATGLAGGQLSAGVHWAKTGRPSGGAAGVDGTIGASASYLFSQGTNITVSYANRELEAPPGVSVDDGKNWYAKIGHKWGNNAVSFGYGESEDVSVAAQGFKDKGFNIGFNHNIPKAKVDLYAGYHFNELDTPATVASVEDITAFVLGTKLKFD